MTEQFAESKRFLQRRIAEVTSWSTIYSMLNQKSQNPGVVSIKKLCDGFEITVRQFFDSPLFDETEQEIK